MERRGKNPIRSFVKRLLLRYSSCGALRVGCPKDFINTPHGFRLNICINEKHTEQFAFGKELMGENCTDVIMIR